MLAMRFWCAVGFLATPVLVQAVELRGETLSDFREHVKTAEKKMEPRFRGDVFLRAVLPEAMRAKLKDGAMLVMPTAGNGNLEIRGGLIQDWTGSTFIPGARLAQVLGVVQDYAHHKEIYQPEVAEAQLRSRTGDDFKVYMRMVKSKLFLTDVLNTEHDVHFAALDSHRAYSRAYSTRIAEVAEAGKPTEHELPEGNDRGFLWRTNSYWFFEEADGGVYVESEAITLTRDIPFGMGKLFGPILRSLPAESLRNSLERTRAAVLARLAGR